MAEFSDLILLARDPQTWAATEVPAMGEYLVDALAKQVDRDKHRMALVDSIRWELAHDDENVEPSHANRALLLLNALHEPANAAELAEESWVSESLHESLHVLGK
jgi:hypothetical protein